MAYITRSPTLDVNHVVADSMRNPDYNSVTPQYYYPYYAFDISKSLIGPALENSWISLQNNKTNQRIWANLNTPYTITRLYYGNYHNNGGCVWDGAYQGSIWGSNIQPEAYGNYSSLILLWQGQFQPHATINAYNKLTPVGNIPCPQYQVFTNITPFQYYTIDINNNYSGNFGIGFRRLEWQENI